MKQGTSKDLSELIKQSKSIVFFGGAGVSTESRIPDFRGSGGLFNNLYEVHGESVRVEEILSEPYFTKHPEIFYQFYKERFQFPDAKYNSAHKFLADLEAEGKLSAVITQNIDGLHQDAGSINVLELHGNIHHFYCRECKKSYTEDEINKMLKVLPVPKCECGGVIRPDIVFYYESLPRKACDDAFKAIYYADLIIIAGTSLNVFPAADMINYPSHGKRKCVIINLSKTPMDDDADIVIRGKVGEIFEEIKDKI